MTLDELKAMNKSDLLKTAIKSFTDIKSDSRYTQDMKCFHRPCLDGTTHCCLAGSLIRLIREPSYEHLPVGNDYDSLVDFVEYLRLGQLKVAFRGLSDKTYKSIFKNNVTRQMTPFDVNPEQFIVDITDFANYITECGL